MDIITIFIIKLLDNILNTSKSIHIAKGKYMTGALLNAASTFFYFIAIIQITKSNSLLNISAICLATFIGTYSSGILFKKTSPDRLYIFRITSNNLEDGIKFADTIRDNNIAIHTTTCYDKDMNKTIFCEVYCNTKEDSKIVSGLIPSDFKYHIQNPIENA